MSRKHLKNYTKIKERHEKKSLTNESNLKPETKRGILIIFLFSLAGLIILSLLEFAGQTGQIINHFLAASFGLARFILPLILIILGYLLFNHQKYNLRGINYLGLFLFLLSLCSLLQLQSEQNFTFENLSQGGGYLGLSLSYPLFKIMGFWATLVVVGSIFLISILIMFETSLEAIVGKSLFLKRIYQNLKLLFLNLRFNKFNKQNKEEINEIPKQEAREEKKEESKIQPNFIARKIEPQNLPIETKTSKAKIDIPLNLLDDTSSKPTSGDIKAQMLTIEKTLANFGIQVEMGEVNVGPTVTQFTLKPAEGIKLSQITALNNDLALALAAHPIRIEAPIPGKSLVGIEVPNQKVAMVRLKEILSSSTFKQKKSNLTICLGRDVAGNIWTADLDKMPHLLVAGATGSGKSVCLNTIIISFLYQNSPDDLKFILVDPKRVEFTDYNGIPHLLTPVITEVPKTINAFKWLLGEMDRRFELLSKHSKRDIHAYNAEKDEKMPYIVLIIDELADLMTVAKGEIEAAIIRLAQMSRAVGIHLVLATQRPSVDIITGLIKANITSRIAFSVASAMDSRTILDVSGAEKLLGRGDMLYLSPELSKPKRLQGAFVGDQEIKRVINFLKTKYGEPEYLEEVTEKPKISLVGFDFSSSDDELLEEAKNVIFEARKASASLLQRKLKIGYARAARLLDLLEEQGIIGPADGAKPREILLEIPNVQEQTNENQQNQ